MNKRQLVENVAKTIGLDYDDAYSLVDATFNTITNALADGDRVVLIGFGSFEVHKHSGRQFNNPATGKIQVVPDSKIPYFKAGKTLKEIVRSAE